ncbi:hypothetical protein ALQ33_101987 [Pseudomonas syringae pv. philadelphi]|uniref:Uncharacterized protein n=1 Tax=Pseudomonas syringae pv. philadelphi TaxID=251706 RepID=A0A3M3ZA59_9PSED|nr:hypothetical protein ALQ33_101987 [Pseudomonas syringae pv. philadelphi]
MSASTVGNALLNFAKVSRRQRLHAPKYFVCNYWSNNDEKYSAFGSIVGIRCQSGSRLFGDYDKDANNHQWTKP